MLVQMNDLDKEKDIDPWLKRFDELDKDGSGALDEEVTSFPKFLFGHSHAPPIFTGSSLI